MPIYMDRHNLSGVTAKDVAHAHQEDLKIQEQYNCRGITYWFDEESGSAFCLVEAPNKEAVENMHKHAHGLVPHQVIKVESKVVESFLGRIQDPQPDNNVDDSGLLILNDSAFRAIMAVEISEFELINYVKEATSSDNIQERFNLLLQQKLIKFSGRRIEHVKDGLLISFTSVSKAIDCAVEINSILQSIKLSDNLELYAKIGLSAGVPVTNDSDFFGETIQQTRRLCKIGKGGQISASSALAEYLSGDDLRKLNKHEAIKFFNSSEEDFLKQLCQVTHSLWNDSTLTVQLFSAKMGLSKSQMYRKMVSLTGLSPNEFLNEYRLKKSLKLLLKSEGNVSEVAYESGFSSPSYFSKCFYKKYGFLPSNCLREAV